eukprot:17818-Eustigmatos_ZCMA.PRE.1
MGGLRPCAEMITEDSQSVVIGVLFVHDVGEGRLFSLAARCLDGRLRIYPLPHKVIRSPEPGVKHMYIVRDVVVVDLPCIL